jgi:hypothetical protein
MTSLLSKLSRLDCTLAWEIHIFTSDQFILSHWYMKDSEVHSQNICDMQLDILAAAVSAEVYHQRFLKLVNIGSCP